MLSENPYLEKILERIPENPGVYQYFDENGTIIYVGKAKNLRRRVHSYFNKTHDDSPKTRILVRKIRDIRYTVVDNETDAFLLENNLIKKHQPRYNILLKDDKTYPSICIRKEHFPRVMMTRKIIRDGSEYFGPYSNVAVVHTLLDLIKKLFPLRSCKLSMNEEDIRKGNYKVCLDYHIKKCKGACEGYQTKEEYDENIAQIREILKGNIHMIEEHLKSEMRAYAERLEFEQAQEVKEKLELIENYRSKSYIVNSNISKVDVFAYDESEKAAYINFLNIVNGCVVQAYTLEYRKRIEEEKESILSTAVYELRQRFKSNSKTIIVPFIPDLKEEDTEYVVPQRGDRRKLLDLAEKNVRQYKLDLLKQEEKLNPEQRSVRILTQLKNDLQMKELPVHIECFDNSNIQGTNPVAACVVFKMGKPSKKDYRHFKIKTVTGANDFASMEEILTRRYIRLLTENEDLPQLIIVDGGKGQLSSAVHALSCLTENEAFSTWNNEEKESAKRKMNDVRLIGIAEKLEEIYFPHDAVPLYLNKDSESLKLIQHLRDEAHRFGITFHRKLRSKSQIKSELDEIEGIGEKTKKELLNRFKSVKKIKEADFDSLKEVIGTSKSKIIYKHFHPNENIDSTGK